MRKSLSTLRNGNMPRWYAFSVTICIGVLFAGCATVSVPRERANVGIERLANGDAEVARSGLTRLTAALDDRTIGVMAADGGRMALASHDVGVDFSRWVAFASFVTWPEGRDWFTERSSLPRALLDRMDRVLVVGSKGSYAAAFEVNSARFIAKIALRSDEREWREVERNLFYSNEVDTLLDMRDRSMWVARVGRPTALLADEEVKEVFSQASLRRLLRLPGAREGDTPAFIWIDEPTFQGMPLFLPEEVSLALAHQGYQTPPLVRICTTYHSEALARAAGVTTRLLLPVLERQIGLSRTPETTVERDGVDIVIEGLVQEGAFPAMDAAR